MYILTRRAEQTFRLAMEQENVAGMLKALHFMLELEKFQPRSIFEYGEDEQRVFFEHAMRRYEEELARQEKIKRASSKTISTEEMDRQRAEVRQRIREREQAEKDAASSRNEDIPESPRHEEVPVEDVPTSLKHEDLAGGARCKNEDPTPESPQNEEVPVEDVPTSLKREDLADGSQRANAAPPPESPQDEEVPVEDASISLNSEDIASESQCENADSPPESPRQEEVPDGGISNVLDPIPANDSGESPPQKTEDSPPTLTQTAGLLR